MGSLQLQCLPTGWRYNHHLISTISISQLYTCEVLWLHLAWLQCYCSDRQTGLHLPKYSKLPSSSYRRYLQYDILVDTDVCVTATLYVLVFGYIVSYCPMLHWYNPNPNKLNQWFYTDLSGTRGGILGGGVTGAASACRRGRGGGGGRFSIESLKDNEINQMYI